MEYETIVQDLRMMGIGRRYLGYQLTIKAVRMVVMNENLLVAIKQGIYEPLAQWAGAGATVPLTGFGHNLAKGVREAIDESGALGILTGGLKSAAGGITAAVFFGFLAALLFRPKNKS